MKKVVSTKAAPAAIGPYSQAIVEGKLIFTSGQIPLDPKSGTIVKGDIKVQAKQAIENLKAILEEAGSSLENIVKTTVFITDMSNFGLINEAYSEYFMGETPARSCVEVRALPKGAALEIEAVAVVKE